MKRKIVAMMLCSIFLFGSCASNKPSWERKRPSTSLFDKLNIKDNPKVTKNDETVLGLLLSGMILFVLHTATTR
jgi:PBP1b-binding outer membrane lipoprotein LpoB